MKTEKRKEHSSGNTIIAEKEISETRKKKGGGLNLCIMHIEVFFYFIRNDFSPEEKQNCRRLLLANRLLDCPDALSVVLECKNVFYLMVLFKGYRIATFFSDFVFFLL